MSDQPAAGYRPGGFDPTTCEVILERDNLIVLGAPANQVFLMKLNAARAVDTADLRAIWPRCSFESPTTAVEAFHRAYPMEEHDEYLADFIRSIVGDESADGAPEP